TPPRDAEEDEPQDEVQGRLPALCAHGPRGGCCGAFRTRSPVTVHAARRSDQGREASAPPAELQRPESLRTAVFPALGPPVHYPRRLLGEDPDGQQGGEPEILAADS